MTTIVLKAGAALTAVMVVNLSPLSTATSAVTAQAVSGGTWTGRFEADGDRTPRLKLLPHDSDRDWQTTLRITRSVADDVRSRAGDGGEVRFEIRREAGTFAFEGTLRGDRGHGRYTFREAPDFRRRMADAGFPRLDDDEVFASAVHDVGVARAQSVRAMGFDVDFDDLMASAIFNVDGALLQEARDAGFQHLDLDDLVAMRIHGVDRTFLDGIRQAGLSVHDVDDAIAFRIHRVTPEFVRDARAMGFGDLDEDDLVAMRIHGVTRVWLDELAEEGFRFDDVDDALAFRIHGITGNWVRELREAGFDDLDADEVLKIRIHRLDRIISKRKG